MKWLSLILILVHSVVRADTTPDSSLPDPHTYKVEEQEGQLHVRTPYGDKTLIGDYGTGEYRMEIPLDEIEPEWVRRKRLEEKNGKKDGGKETNLTTNNTEKDNNTVETKEKETKIIETKIIDHGNDEGQSVGKVPPKVVVEYDDSDRLVLEANRLYNKHKFDEALAAIDELLRRRPTFVRAWIMKGSVMYIRGHHDLAKSAWRQAQAIEPENADIKSILEKYK